MTDSVHIPLNKLVLWDGNVRKTGAHEALEERMHPIVWERMSSRAPIRLTPEGAHVP
jgi:hypothetical protein